MNLVRPPQKYNNILTKEFLTDARYKYKLCEIEKNTGIPELTIRNYMKKYNIELYTKPLNLNLTKEELYDMYWNKWLSLKEIGQIYKVSGGTICNKLKKYNIKRRTDSYGSFKPFPTLTLDKLAETDKAYLAGLIDGEGSIHAYLGKAHIFNTKVAICNTHKPTIDWVQQQINGHIQTTLKGYQYNRNHNKNCATVFISKIPDIKILLLAVLPYLKIKKEQATIMLRICNNYINKALNGIKNSITEEDFNNIKQLLKLNSRGLVGIKVLQKQTKMFKNLCGGVKWG